MSKIKIEMGNSYKLGMHEVVGLREALVKALEPVRAHLNRHVYWTELEFIDAEYKSRDGFIPNRDNCGGLMLDFVVPKCEELSFDFLEFGECDGCNEDCSNCTREESKSGECMAEIDGHLDARLRIWLKFEGIDENDRLLFYVNACGGNGDAPYFRVGYLADLFEASFTAKSVEDVPKAAAKHIKALIKKLGGGK